MEYFFRKKLFEGTDPHSQCHAGYQLEFFCRTAGNEAAITIGHVLNKETDALSEYKFKGSGPAPYSSSPSACILGIMIILAESGPLN